LYAKGEPSAGAMTANRTVLLSQKIFDEIETRIVQRTYPPGSHLAEDEIAEQLGVSRTPVREAFRMLARAGWLDIQPHAGAYVRNPTMDDVRQVFEVRQTLEDRAARLAARHATSVQLRELRRVLERGFKEVRKSSPKQMTLLNSAFHAQIAIASSNQIVARFLEDLGKQLQWHFSAVALHRGEGSWQEHQAILEAIEAHDPERAGALAVEHTQRTQETFFLQLLGDGFTRTAPSEGVSGA
jgi:DNA-binding GntR family transcriptional regulator